MSAIYVTGQTAQAALSALGRRIRIMALGDSMTGANPGDVSVNAGAWRRAFQMAERQVGDDLQWSGTKREWPDGPYTSGDGANEGHPGYKIEELTAGRIADGNTGYPGWVATTGQPDVVIVSAGTNNFTLDTGATCLTKFGALLDVILATSPSAFVVVWSPPTPPTANPNAVNRNAFVAGLPALCASKGTRVFYCDAGTPLTKASMGVGDSPQWTHPNERGYTQLGRALYDFCEAHVFPPATGELWPRPYVTATAQACASFSVPATARIYWAAANAALEPGAGNWLVAFQTRLAALPASFATFFVYGGSHANEVVIGVTSTGACTIYAGGGAPQISALPNVFATLAWTSVVVAYDATAQALSLWVNGAIAYCKMGVPPLAHGTGETVTSIGYSGPSNTIAPTGLIRSMTVASGPSVPGWDTGASTGPGPALRVAVEAFHVAQTMPPGVTGHYPLDDAASPSASDMGGDSSSAWGIGVAQSAAGAVPTPWDAATYP